MESSAKTAKEKTEKAIHQQNAHSSFGELLFKAHVSLTLRPWRDPAAAGRETPLFELNGYG